MAILVLVLGGVLLAAGHGALMSEGLRGLALCVGCLGTAFVFGLAAEVLLLSIHLRRAGAHPLRGIFRMMLTELLVAVGVGVVIAAVLASPILDSARMGILILVLPALALVIVAAGQAAVLARASKKDSRLPNRSWRAWLATCSISSITALAVAVLAGRAYLWVFFPALG